MCLLSEMPAFLDEFERGAPNNGILLTYWVDIFFNDQNSDNVPKFLREAEAIYRNSPHHAVLMMNGTLFRGWCVFETATRTNAAMARCRLDHDGMAALVRAGDPAFSRLVIHPSLTDAGADVFRDSDDRFGAMRTFDPRDLAHIQRSILANFGTAAAFNEAMRAYRKAAVEAFVAAHPGAIGVGAAFAVHGDPQAIASHLTWAAAHL
jgi:hypothetical protein